MRFIILEDNEDRRQAMQAVLGDRFPQVAIEFFPAVTPMIERLEASGLYDVALVSLDHDLDIIVEPNGRRIDPGTGVDAATWLADQPAVAPVIVHTTNTLAGDRMMDLLVQSGWNCSRVTPYGGQAWIGERWLPMVRKLVVAHGPNVSLATLGLQILKCQWRLGEPVDRVLFECIRAARCLIAGSTTSNAISIQFLHLNRHDQLAPLIPEDGILENSFLGHLKFEFEGLVIDTGPRAVEDMTVSREFRNTLRHLKAREVQIDLIRMPALEPMQALMVCASFSEHTPLNSHRAQSALADLRNLVELALAHEMRIPQVPDSALTARKRKR